MHHLHFNHMAVLVSAILMWVLGALWYSPMLFAKPWMAMVPLPTEGKNQKMITGMVSSFILDIVMAFVLAHVILWSGAERFQGGAFVGFIVWLGFFAAPSLPQGIYESRPFKLFAINQGYTLVGLLIMGGVLAAWH